jgi:hypothetical protein
MMSNPLLTTFRGSQRWWKMPGARVVFQMLEDFWEDRKVSRRFGRHLEHPMTMGLDSNIRYDVVSKSNDVMFRLRYTQDVRVFTTMFHDACPEVALKFTL